MHKFRIEPEPVVDTYPKTVQRRIYRLSDGMLVGILEREIMDGSGVSDYRLCNENGTQIDSVDRSAPLPDEDILNWAEKHWGIPERDQHGRESDKKGKGLER